MSGRGVIAEAAGQAGQAIYSTGDAASNLNAYLTRKAGMYPDIVEQLVANHLEKGDSMSALITSEWYMLSITGYHSVYNRLACRSYFCSE